MSSLRLHLLSFLAILGLASAQATAVNASDITIWPQCAQRCIPLGLAPPANCGSLTNIECVCNNPTFLLSIAECEQTTCTRPEVSRIAQLSNILCAPFGGLGPSASSAAVNFQSTFTNTLPATPSLVGTATAPSAANASDISIYPQCAQSCSEEATAANICPQGGVECVCGADYRAFSVACNIRNCNREELLVVQDLAIKLCGPLYATNSPLSASVATALATATAGAGSSISSSVAASFTPGATGVQGAAGGVSGSSNGSVTSPGGGSPPAPFTGAAGRLGGENMALVVSVLVGAVGMVVMVRL